MNTPADARKAPSSRLVESPVFVISTVRSGSTLLRCVLNSHSQLHADHEMHLGGLRVEIDTKPAAAATDEMGLTATELEHMLWDRLLDHQLKASGKSVLVEKTPGNVAMWKRLAECWPHARYIFLLRHPVHVLESLSEIFRDQLADISLSQTPEEVEAKVRSSAVAQISPMLEAVAEARAHLDGITVRYEDLTTSPDVVTKTICDYLGVPWEAEMLNYGSHDHGSFRMFLGDWRERISSGVIQPHRRLPAIDEVPADLAGQCKALGYA
ncbi:sulfotransferase [Streptomyces vinaceus]|uniref:Sulfotransferase n=1 Tax=Streptomyces vinaceus TaxID=1960 RepID=A0A5J6JC75_STRVI|nr:sulfotransferase [Streptomyces vinaceus]QEV48499.1 sulfotransferase [Streptomyces vinaceus]GHE34988.1 sulfotransferase family protein [Streptomyces vinaceus]